MTPVFALKSSVELTCNRFQTYMEVLGRYQQMTKDCGRQAQIDCCEILTYKANIIRINLGSRLQQMTHDDEFKAEMVKIRMLSLLFYV